MGQFTLRCLECGSEQPRASLHCARGCPSLLRTHYQQRAFRPGAGAGLFRFLDWLPCTATVDTRIGTVVHPAVALGDLLGLRRLFVAVNGYWPAIGAFNPTATFKDLEAIPTLSALAEDGFPAVVVASAGNTARAFAHASEIYQTIVLLVVPEAMLHRLWLPANHPASRVRVISVAGSSDYSQAIRLGDEIARRFGLRPEGGARNVARRDGLATVLLEAVRVLRRLPDHYFQAVGSGTGAIAVYEASLRLQGDAEFGDQHPPRLHLSQNAPFDPIYRAWSQGTGINPSWFDEIPHEGLFASVLANRNPPYSVRGGLVEILAATQGMVYSVGSSEAAAAGQEFEQLEGIDLEPAAAVAVASLKQAVRRGLVQPDELVLLNLTGAGLQALQKDLGIRSLQADLRVTEATLGEVGRLL